MLHFLFHMLLIGLGIIGWELGKYIVFRIRMPYRWKCPRCGFKVETDSRDSFEISVSSHNHSRLQEYKPR